MLIYMVVYRHYHIRNDNLRSQFMLMPGKVLNCQDLAGVSHEIYWSITEKRLFAKPR